MKVAVLGASGGMGSFFARYFLERGYTVRGSDPSAREETPASRGRRFTSFSNNVEAVKGCDVTFIAVPIERTLKVARQVAPNLKPGSTVVEISSVKGDTLPGLKKLLGRRVRVLSIHPLFGPALESTKGMKIAVIVGKNKGRDASVEAAERLFPSARLIPMTPKEHDKTMSVILSLTHLLNVVYAGTVARFLSPAEFARVSTPNSSMQLALAEAILSQDPGLSYAIQAENAYTKTAGKAALRELESVLSLIERSDSKAFRKRISELSKRYGTEKRASAAIKEIYSAAAG